MTTDIRAYYEALAVELADGGPIATWGAGRWFYDGTEAGKVLLATREELKKAGAPFLIWRYMAQGPRQSGMERMKNVSVRYPCKNSGRTMSLPICVSVCGEQGPLNSITGQHQ